MEEVLVTPGQKRQRMIEQGVEEGNEALLKLDKSERKRLKKENEEILGLFKNFLIEKITEVNVRVTQ